MASLMSTVDLLVLMLALATFIAIRDYQKRRGLPYPPGPRPLPLIGNLLDIPREFSWLWYLQLSKKYGMVHFLLRLLVLLTEDISGDIMSFHVFGQVIVVLNSVEMTKDLLEKRGDIYSDRPVIPIYEMSVFFIPPFLGDN
jgi:hypothetical protein